MPPAAAPDPLLEVHGAHRRYGDRAALAGVDLRARPGELLALLGPNGAGKSTLLGAISGRVRLDDGEVRVAGGNPRDAAVRRRIGLVPQSIALYPRLSVRANLAIFGRLAGLKGAAVAPAVEAALAWSGLADRAGDAVGSLSGGMQRRVNIAAGTLHRPALLLLDEPTVGLDPAARAAVHAVLRRLRDEGMALVMTTHDLPEAEELADRVAFLADGRVCAEGLVAELVVETFAGGQELNVILGRDPDGAGLAALAAAGLMATSQARLWVGLLADAGTDPYGELAGLRAALGAAGLAVAELRVRSPGLQGVFLRLTGYPPG